MSQITFVQEAHLEISHSGYIIDTGEIPSVRIILEENTEIHYTFLGIHPKQHIERNIFIKKWGVFSWNGIIIDDIDATIILESQGDNTRSQLHLLGLAVSNIRISLEWIARVTKPYRKVFTRVDQTNILIGDNAKVRGVPKLEIATEDIEWGHSCKIHRLAGEILFYLESRGLEAKNAETLLLNSEILHHLNTLPAEQKEYFCTEIHKKLREKA